MTEILDSLGNALVGRNRNADNNLLEFWIEWIKGDLEKLEELNHGESSDEG